MKKMILGFILGLVVAGGIGVLAYTITAKEIGYTPKDSSWKVNNVNDAINDLKKNGGSSSNKFCELKSGEALVIGSMYECDPGDGVKRNFYVLAVDNNKVKLIMEHNITEGSGTTAMTWMNAMKYFRTGAGASTKSAWTNVVDVDLPMAQDIANAVGNTGWNMEDKNLDGWFYFDKNGSSYGQTQVANTSNLSNFRWLYNYTRECSAYGCDSATSLGSTEAYGYWTRDIVAQQKDSTGRAWCVHSRGDLTISFSSDTNLGVRPVITVLKSNIQ